MRKFRAPIERWQLVVGLLIAVGSPVLTMAFTYGRDSNRLKTVETAVEAHDVRIKALEGSSSRTDRNVVRIGQKLGIPMEMPK